jgi:hypothetical protein
MKIHSEISISRVVLYLSVVLSLSGGSISDNDLPNFRVQGGSATGPAQNDHSLMRNLPDTSIGQNNMYRLNK